MSRTTMTSLAAIGILGAASAAQAALPDAGIPRMVGGGLRHLVVAMEQSAVVLRIPSTDVRS